MATGFYKPYLVKGDSKVENIVIGELHYMRRAQYCTFSMTATDEYDLPMYTCEFDQTVPRTSMTADFLHFP
jgi:hypothetical protein